MEDLKSGLDQLRLDRETESRLNCCINELGKSNRGLIAEKIALERDAHNLAKELDGVKRDLAHCQGQLNTKSDELAAALAVPSEDPLLRAKIQILESTNSKLESWLESANQKVSTLKEEIQSHGETSNFKEQQIKELERSIDIAQTTIKNLSEEKSKYIADKERETEEACWNITQKFTVQEAAMKRNFEDEIKKLDQKYKDRDAELNSAQEDLSRLREAGMIYNDTIKKLNQKQRDREVELQFARDEAQTLREANDTLDSTVKDLNRKQKEVESELASAKDEVRRAQEVNVSTGDSVKKLDQEHKEVEADLKAAREEVQTLLEGNSVLGDAVKKHQAEIAAFQESFAQQAVHLKRLTDHNPGRQAFEGIGGGLQLTRNEISDLRNQLRFIENNNAQNISASNRVQTVLESHLLSIDILQRERDAAEDQVAILRKENEQQKEALASRVVSTGQHPGVHVEESMMHRLVKPLQAGDRALRAVSLSTPEASLRQAIRQVGSGSNLRQASVMQNHVTLGQGVHGTSASSELVSNSSTRLQQAVSAPQSLRPAERKSSNPGPLQQSQNTTLRPIPQRPTYQYQNLPTRVEGSTSVPKDFQGIQNSEVSLDATPLMDESSSSLTDLDDIQDRLEKLDRDNKSQSDHGFVRPGGILETRSTHVETSNPVVKSFVQISRQNSKRSWIEAEFESLDDVVAAEEVKTAGAISHTAGQPPAKKIKVAASIPPSIEEESRKRRTSMPMKSAMKKRVTAEATPGADQQHANVAETSTPAPMIRSAPAVHRNSNLLPAHKDHGLAAFKGYVSGKSAKAGLAALLNNDQPGLPSSKTPAHKPAVTAPSPIHLPRRQGQAPVSNQGRQRSILRMAPARRLSERVIPDSQEV